MINKGVEIGDNRWFYTHFILNSVCNQHARFKQESLAHISKKLIMHNLKNFALAIIIDKNGVKRGMFPYIDWINGLILYEKDLE